MPKEISVETAVSIRWILDPAQVFLVGVLQDIGTVCIQHRPDQPTRTEAANATTGRCRPARNAGVIVLA